MSLTDRNGVSLLCATIIDAAKQRIITELTTLSTTCLMLEYGTVKNIRPRSSDRWWLWERYWAQAGCLHRKILIGLSIYLRSGLQISKFRGSLACALEEGLN